MADTTPKTHNLRQKDALPRVRSRQAELLNVLLNLTDDKLKRPFEVSLSGDVITIASSEIQHLETDGTGGTQSSYKKSPVPGSAGYNVVAESTINVDTGAGTGDLESATPSIPVAVAASEYVWMGIEKRPDNKVYLIFGTPNAVAGSATYPDFIIGDGFSAIAMVLLQDDGSGSSGTTWNFLSPSMDNFIVFEASGGGGGSSTGSGGGELADLQYYVKLEDSFDETPSSSLPVDISAGKTASTNYVSKDKLYLLNYDAAKTVTGTGTAMVMSATPSFTVKAGDVLVVGSEVREITSLTDQQNYTIESAFTADPSTAACTVSQAVHTVDLNAFTYGGAILAASSQFTEDITEALISYEDSETSEDIIPDFGSVARAAYCLSADGSDWSDKNIRPQDLSILAEAIAAPTSGSNLYLRFFANKTSGTGTINLLGFKARWHKIEGQIDGQNYFTAFARVLSSDFVNCSHALVGGKSRFTFTSSYPMGLNPGDPSGSALEVYINGQIVPRYIDGTLVDTSGAYFKEISGYIIEMDTNYSAAAVDFQFKAPALVIDTNTQNTTRITSLEDRAHGKIVTKSADYSINSGDSELTILIDDTSSDRTIDLPPLADSIDMVITIKNTSTDKGKVTVDGDSSETIEGYTSIDLDFKNATIKVQATSSGWEILYENLTSYKKIYDLSVSGPGTYTVLSARGLSSRTLDGNWLIDVIVSGSCTSLSRTSYTITITGITTISALQPILGIANITTAYIASCFANSSTNTVTVNHSSATTSAYRFSGKMELASKPTFVE